MRSVLVALALLSSLTVSAQQPAATNAQSDPAKFFAGLTLVDQNGRTVDLYKDVMKDHTVAIHSFFASCPGACPIMLGTMKTVQTRVGTRMDKEVRLVSITVDPLNDKPAELKALATKMGAKPGWLFLTGTPTQVDAALRKIGQFTSTRDDHKTVLLTGNVKTGLWKRIDFHAEAVEVQNTVMSVADDKGTSR